MTTLRSWFLKDPWWALLRLTGAGAFAGLASWVLAYLLFPLLGANRPGGDVLFWAVLRGALFAVVLGLILWVYWSRRGEIPRNAP